MAVGGPALASRSVRRAESMTRRHRTWHAWGWIALGPAVAIGLMAGLLNRRPVPMRDEVKAARAAAKLPINTAGQVEGRP